MKKLTVMSGIVVLVICGVLFFWGMTRQEEPSVALPLEGQPVLGSKDAPVTIVEIGDFSCGSCRSFALNEFPKIKKELIDTGKAKFYFIDNQFLSEESVLAGMFGQGIYQQNPGRFWDFYHAFNKEKQRNKKDWVTMDGLMAFVRKEVPGIDYEKLREDVEKKRVYEEVEKDRRFCMENHINFVPTVYVNGIKVEPTFEEIKSEIK